MVKQAALRTVDFEPIDRLEEKIKLLVGMLARLRSEQARAADENARLAQFQGGRRRSHEELRRTPVKFCAGSVGIRFSANEEQHGSRR